MSLFPNEDILTKEIELWKCFANSFSSKEDRKLFTSMLNDCYKYATAINSKGQPFPTEPLIMALLLSQHKIIDWLTKQISKYQLPINNKVIKKLEEELANAVLRKIPSEFKSLHCNTIDQDHVSVNVRDKRSLRVLLKYITNSTIVDE